MEIKISTTKSCLNIKTFLLILDKMKKNHVIPLFNFSSFQITDSPCSQVRQKALKKIVPKILDKKQTSARPVDLLVLKTYASLHEINCENSNGTSLQRLTSQSALFICIPQAVSEALSLLHVSLELVFGVHLTRQ